MNPSTISRIASRIAQEDGEEDAALANIDAAVDAVMAGVITIEENLGEVRADTVPEKAALETAKDILENALKPYVADFAKAMSAFD